MSASAAVQVAVYDALVADAGLADFLGATEADARIYEGLAPAGTALETDDGAPWPYITLGDAGESAQDVFCGRGYADTLRLSVWVPGPRKLLAKLGYAEMHRVLDGATLPLGTGLSAMGRVAIALERTLTDPDGGATQAIATLTIDAARVA